jgi:hypothetical protein
MRMFTSYHLPNVSECVNTGKVNDRRFRTRQHKVISLACIFKLEYPLSDRLCGLVARVPGYRSRGPGSIPGATGFSEK